MISGSAVSLFHASQMASMMSSKVSKNPLHARMHSKRCSDRAFLDRV
jgi:hypothetical protein